VEVGDAALGRRRPSQERGKSSELAWSADAGTGSVATARTSTLKAMFLMSSLLQGPNAALDRADSGATRQRPGFDLTIAPNGHRECDILSQRTGPPAFSSSAVVIGVARAECVGLAHARRGVGNRVLDCPHRPDNDCLHPRVEILGRSNGRQFFTRGCQRELGPAVLRPEGRKPGRYGATGGATIPAREGET